mgnify:CR=1 FL=1
MTNKTPAIVIDSNVLISAGILSKLAQLVQFFDAVADERVSRDPDDDKFVSLALDAGATIIISGDRDLKEIRMHKGIEIMSPSAFLERFTE